MPNCTNAPSHAKFDIFKMFSPKFIIITAHNTNILMENKLCHFLSDICTKCLSFAKIENLSTFYGWAQGKQNFVVPIGLYYEKNERIQMKMLVV